MQTSISKLFMFCPNLTPKDELRGMFFILVRCLYLVYTRYNWYVVILGISHISVVWCLYLVYPRYNPYISMTYEISRMVCDRNGCLLQTFGCLAWESELYSGIMLAKCSHHDDPSPFNMLGPGHRFHNMNPRVHGQSLSQGYTRDILKKLYQGYK